MICILLACCVNTSPFFSVSQLDKYHDKQRKPLWEKIHFKVNCADVSFINICNGRGKISLFITLMYAEYKDDRLHWCFLFFFSPLPNTIKRISSIGKELETRACCINICKQTQTKTLQNIKYTLSIIAKLDLFSIPLLPESKIPQNLSHITWGSKTEKKFQSWINITS